MEVERQYISTSWDLASSMYYRSATIFREDIVLITYTYYTYYTYPSIETF